jgi:hypothetical protein
MNSRIYATELAKRKSKRFKLPELKLNFLTIKYEL